MRITLNERSPQPLSDQLAAELGERIRRGSLAPGARLPTVRALAEDLEIAVNTVAKAYRTLEREGLVEGRGRRGTYVVERLPEGSSGTERRLAEAAGAFVRRGTQLGFGEQEIRRALGRALRER